jgi:hypothetical protein
MIQYNSEDFVRNMATVNCWLKMINNPFSEIPQLAFESNGSRDIVKFYGYEFNVDKTSTNYQLDLVRFG